MNSKLYFLLPLAFFVISSILLVFALQFEWLGTNRGGVMLFCELARDGLIKQPSNSFSNLGFSLVGLYIGWLTFQNRFPPKNLFTRNKMYPFVYSLILVFLGAGSFAMHATNAPWGGFLDLLAMFLASSFFLCFSLKRITGYGDLALGLFYIFNVVVCSYIYLSSWNHFGFILSIAELIVFAHILISISVELYLQATSKVQIETGWGYFGVFSMITAFVIWNLSRTHESIWCNPTSLLQGHAVWHLLIAVAFYAFFRYYASEVEEG